MFCPKGFTPFELFANYAEDLVQVFAYEVLFPSVGNKAEDPDGYGRRVREAKAISGLLVRWLVDYVLLFQPVPIYAACRDGRVFRVSYQIAEHADNPSRYFFEWPVREGSEISRYLDPKSRAHAWCYEPQYPLIDELYWRITVSAKGKFLERGEELSFLIDDLREVAKDFEGWFLCIEDSDKARLLAALDSEFASVRDHNSDQRPRRGPGRTRKTDGVLEAYQSTFPEGHGKLTVKEIAGRLRPVVPYPFEEDTVRRALGLRK